MLSSLFMGYILSEKKVIVSFVSLHALMPLILLKCKNSHLK